MDTLDEVIKNLEDGTEHLSAMLISKETWGDALHYLKEYRSEKAMWEADRKGYLNWIEQYKEAREKHQQAVIELKKNPALTWDELKAMEGKPVWVEESAENGLWWTYWVIWEGDNAVLPKKDYSTKWQAYRKERK